MRVGLAITSEELEEHEWFRVYLQNKGQSNRCSGEERSKGEFRCSKDGPKAISGNESVSVIFRLKESVR